MARMMVCFHVGIPIFSLLRLAEGRRQSSDRPLINTPHPGAVATHSLCAEEEAEWRRWSPKVGDLVLVELDEEGFWPGKIIDKKNFFQGRTIPRGSHFYPVRVYNEHISPTVTVKSRIIPLRLRPSPPLLAKEALLGAYHHPANPATFDMLATQREAQAAHNRTHPGVGADGEVDKAKLKEEKESWNKLVNWAMNERRMEKLRVINEERERRLSLVAKAYAENGAPEETDAFGAGPSISEEHPKKRRVEVTIPSRNMDSPTSVSKMSSGEDRGGIFKVTKHGRSNSPCRSIFGPHANTPCSNLPPRTASPLSSRIRPGLITPQRPMSPRRIADRKRTGIYTGMGEYSPRGRGSTYTPPRILPSGDETAPQSTGSPAPSLSKFDFVSPLGPARRSINGDGPSLGRSGSLSGSLEVVKEEPAEDEGAWTLVSGKRGRRGGSAPCRDKAADMDVAGEEGGSEEMEL